MDDFEPCPHVCARCGGCPSCCTCSAEGQRAAWKRALAARARDRRLTRTTRRQAPPYAGYRTNPGRKQ